MLSRAGANAIGELLALRKPNLLIPLPLSASRGDQIENAASFAKQGFSMVLQQEQMTPEALAERLTDLWANRAKYVTAMENSPAQNGTQAVLAQIEKVLEQHKR